MAPWPFSIFFYRKSSLFSYSCVVSLVSHLISCTRNCQLALSLFFRLPLCFSMQGFSSLVRLYHLAPLFFIFIFQYHSSIHSILLHFFSLDISCLSTLFYGEGKHGKKQFHLYNIIFKKEKVSYSTYIFILFKIIQEN